MCVSICVTGVYVCDFQQNRKSQTLDYIFHWLAEILCVALVCVSLGDKISNAQTYRRTNSVWLSLRERQSEKEREIEFVCVCVCVLPFQAQFGGFQCCKVSE